MSGADPITGVTDAEHLPLLLTTDEVAKLLRTSRKAVYCMAERGQLPGRTRIGRRVLFRSRVLVDYLDRKCSAPTKEEAMSVKVRPYRNGGWEVDITFRLPDDSKYRERSKAPVDSKSGALRWGQDRERHLLQHGPPQPAKEVPTLEQFAPRFIEGYAVANRQKPSEIAAKLTILNVHLVPLLGLSGWMKSQAMTLSG